MMKDISGIWKTAYFRGKVLKKDWGKWNGYPGIILDNEANEIKSFVGSDFFLYISITPLGLYVLLKFCLGALSSSIFNFNSIIH